MSKAIRCDVCGRSTPDVNCKFERRKHRWYEWHYDSQGGYHDDLDVCEYCWNEYKNWVNNRLAMKEVSSII
jgi:hypothetical protein